MRGSPICGCKINNKFFIDQIMRTKTGAETGAIDAQMKKNY